MKKWQISLIAFVCLLLLSSLMYGVSLYHKYKATLRAISITEDVNSNTNSNNENQHDEAITDMPFILLLNGISARKQLDDGGRSDTIMLALIDAPQKKVTLISIPRDSYVEIPEYGMKKINAAYPIGGSKLLEETLENWLAIDIHGFVSIDFDGFIKLVDLIGGIEVEVTRYMEYDDPTDGTNIRLSPGRQTLEGKKALDYVRFRHSNDGNHASDYDRMKRQQEALGGLVDKVSSFKSLTKLNSMMDIMGNNVKTTLTPKEIQDLIKAFAAFSTEDLEKTSIQGEGYYINGGWYEKIPQEELERVKLIMKDFIYTKE
ncbi:LCP family protein [Alkaliphilus pronyensis]|nr:LCP family protein [Alkaliphilus pronyensis]